MQCSCGGSTVTQISFRKKKFRSEKTGEEKAGLEELDTDVCEACGRIGGARIYAVKSRYEKKLVARRI